MLGSSTPTSADAWAPMTWTKPEYSTDEVRAAGEALRRNEQGQADYYALSEAQLEGYMAVLNNWRAAHHWPLNHLHTNLKNHIRASKLMGTLTVQRVKRTPAILYKLRNNRRVDLAIMQDIGGCRCIVDTVQQVYEIRDRHKASRAAHILYKEDDYLKNRPNRRGYRGIHLIYHYQGAHEYRNLPIEIQLRTKLQHMWGTANEVAGLMRGEAFKSGVGDPNWLRMFALLGSVFAIEESTPIVPNTPSSLQELRDEIVVLDGQLRFRQSVQGYAAGVNLILTMKATKEAHYYLLKLSVPNRQLFVTPFRSEERLEAERQLAAAEKEMQSATSNTITDVVLIAAPSVKGLRRAYPNYMLDTKGFIRRVERLIQHPLQDKQGKLFT